MGSAPKPVPPKPPSSVGRLISSSSFDLGAFPPGAVLGERYRIVGLLGRGGMGEVYRADDLKLGQAVALKFLPKAVSGDEALLARFHAEVRLARQVSHPNVCRIYDIGEIEGRHFLSMEYVDGEDLASLLKRIGHLPADKTVDIARQLCAGLHAAHEKGVLHRDLKPANIMLDGRGRVRITDFGLAVAAEEAANVGEVSGTPAYMAPEQLAGKPASVRSDLYALGLVLYEVATGKRAFDAPTLAEMRRKHEQETPAAPSAILAGFDPAVERVILRCLEKDPRARPSSAVQLAGALPGGDPLAAALAAGETPSPEMVAAFGGKGVLSVGSGATLLGAAVVLLAAFALLPAPEILARRVPLERPPDFLSGVAADIAARAGFSSPHPFAVAGFEPDNGYLQFRKKKDSSSGRWNGLGEARPGPIRFWCRFSPRPLVTQRPSGTVVPNDPPEDTPGMMSVFLDPWGRLISFRALPESVSAGSAAAEPDWKPFFAAAGLDLERFRPAAPERRPASFADSRFAWTAPEEGSSSAVRVEAASLAGKPVSFGLVFPWSPPPTESAGVRTAGSGFADTAYLVVSLLGWIGGIVLARRNWRLKRGDRRGAFRVAVCLLSVAIVNWLFRANHSGDLGMEWEMTVRGLGDALFWAATVWILYLALEPSVRQRWPNILISWNRLLAWDYRDPLVGRDILLGAFAGIGLHVVMRGEYLAPLLLGRGPDAPAPFGVWQLARVSGSIGAIAGGARTALIESLGTLILLLLFRTVLRNRWLADAVLAVAFSFIVLFWDAPFWVYWPLALCRSAVWLALITRVGLLAFATGLFFWYGLMAPISLQPSCFYFGRSVVTLVLLAGVALYGFVTAIGGRAAFARAVQND